MNDDATQGRGEIDPLLQIDEWCDEFENRLKAGRRTPIDEFLLDIGVDPAAAPPALLAELVGLEADYQGRTSKDAEPFAPGTVLAGRYRVEGLLGKGGMGEVYRAQDLTLRQTVALKFLPARASADPARREEFKQEVLVSRQVSHPHVCRIHDYAEHAGQPFLSMEYIDGKDLAALLKQVKRLPEDTAVELARQLCLGLAAAHAQGLLHRDLKPQNVMLDGHGQARITDFGLAGQAGTFTGEAVRAGTPLYQAPEQLDGTSVTRQSDIYALGLILYEMFTGKRAFQATTVSQLAQLHRDSTPSAPSGHVPNLNAAVERIILKCLERDPANRPASALDVLQALPGGELAAAVDAGQMPSPEAVADAGGEGSLTLAVALALFAVAFMATLLVAWLNDFVALFRQVPQDLSPRELIVRARGHLESFGYDPHADYTAHGVTTEEPALRRLRADYPQVLDPAVMRVGLPAVRESWHRQSRKPLAQRLAANDASGWSMPGRVLPNEPPLRDPGMTCTFLDLCGRLVEFHAVPDPTVPALAPGKEIDPKVLLGAAGLTDGQLRESITFRRVPPVFADRRMAWEGEYPNLPGVPVRVEAAFFRGRPVYFHVGVAAREGEAERGDRLLPNFMPDDLLEYINEQKHMIMGLIALPFGGWFAWVNWKRGRANPFGATVIAVAFIVSGLVVWLLAAKHVPNASDELSMFTAAAGRALFDGLLLWLAYLALEPWVRQNSPWRLISWSRLMEGQWKDPLVGRDVLTGVTVAAGFGLLLVLLRAAPRWLGYPPDLKLFWDAAFVEGTGDLVVVLQIAVLVAMRSFFLFFLIVLACGRWTWLAAILNVAVWALPYQHGGGYLLVIVAVGLAYAAASYFVFLRAGLLGYIAFNLVEQLHNYIPTTTDLSAWYAGISTQCISVIVGLAAYGTWAACRTRPVNRVTA